MSAWGLFIPIILFLDLNHPYFFQFIALLAFEWTSVLYLPPFLWWTTELLSVSILNKQLRWSLDISWGFWDYFSMYPPPTHTPDILCWFNFLHYKIPIVSFSRVPVFPSFHIPLAPYTRIWNPQLYTKMVFVGIVEQVSHVLIRPLRLSFLLSVKPPRAKLKLISWRFCTIISV